MKTTTPCSSDAYYQLIDSLGTHVVVLGEFDEQWTQEVIKALDLRQVTYHFFPWHAIEDVRLQLEIVYYPVTQVWIDGGLKGELIGYQAEEISTLITRSFIRRKRG